MSGLHLSLRGGFGGVSAAFSPFSVTLFEAMEVQPDAARKIVIDTFIKALVKAGVWDKLDVLQVYAAHTEQAALLNWINPAVFTGSPQNAPTWTEDEGYDFSGGTQRVDTNWSPADGPNFALDDACIFAWPFENQQSNGILVGNLNATDTSGLFLAPRHMTIEDAVIGAVNCNNITFASGSVTDGRGLLHVERTASNLVTAYKDGESIGTSSTASVEVVDLNLWVGSRNFNGSPNVPTTTACSIVGAGASLGSDGAAALYSAALAYMQAVGAVE